jgi:hypothetical protein
LWSTYLTHLYKLILDNNTFWGVSIFPPFLQFSDWILNCYEGMVWFSSFYHKGCYYYHCYYYYFNHYTTDDNYHHMFLSLFGCIFVPTMYYFDSWRAVVYSVCLYNIIYCNNSVKYVRLLYHFHSVIIYIILQDIHIVNSKCTWNMNQSTQNNLRGIDFSSVSTIFWLDIELLWRHDMVFFILSQRVLLLSLLLLLF